MQDDLIFDVGLHTGEDTEFYLKKGFKVVAIEANKALCDKVAARLHTFVENGGLTIVNCAITDKAGPVSFFINARYTYLSTTLPNWAERNELVVGEKFTETTVDGLEFGSIIEKYGVPHYLKIDIEGADRLCLLALKPLASRPKYVSVESDKRSWTRLAEEFALFKSLGYSKFKVVLQRGVPQQKCPMPAREGNYVDQTFELGASGLFGAELPGDWLSEKEALEKYRWIFLQYRLFGDYSPFRKLLHLYRAVFRKYQLFGDSKEVREAPVNMLRKLFHPGHYDTHASQV